MKFNQAYRKIVIESKGSAAQSDFGTPTATWTTYHTAAAEVRSGLGSGAQEGDEQGRETAINRKEFTIRYFAGITENMRISYDSRYYDILSVHEFGREHLKITAQAKY